MNALAKTSALMSVTLGVLLLMACRTPPEPAEAPAVLTNPSAESRLELRRVVSGALHRDSVTLADDALTRESVLIIERARARDPNGQLLNGRELDKPEHFHLVKEGERCVLVRERTGERWTLASATCAPK
jgi:hypothetical protein